MTTRYTAGGFIIAIAAAYSAGTTVSQDPAPPQVTEAQVTQMMQDLQQAHDNPTIPGPFHAKLDHFIGRWDVTIRVWPMGPAAAPVQSIGEATIEWILDGRFAMEKLDAQLNMGDMKMPLDSISMTGYDNYRNQYVGTMCSAMSTEMIVFEGGVSPDGRRFDYYGTMHEPMLNVTGRLIRFTTTIVDADHHSVEVFDLHAGPDHKVLEFAYARR